MAYASGSGYVTGSGNAGTPADLAGMSDDLVLTLWSSKLHMETLRELWFTDRGMTKQESGDEGVYERSASAPIIIKDELGVGRGQRIRMALRKQLKSGLPSSDNSTAYDHQAMNRSESSGDASIPAKHYDVATAGTLVDAEENMELYDLECTVEMLKHAVAFSAPEIQNMRTNFNMEDEAAVALRDWLVAQKEEAILDTFYFKYPAHIIRRGTAGQSAVVPHPNLIWANDATDVNDIDTNDKLDAAALRQIYKEARTRNINPLNVGGAECFVLLAHVRGLNDLYSDAATGNGTMEVFNRAGTGQDNPIISRAEMYYSGICVHEYNRVRGANLADADAHAESETINHIVLGADALVQANATEPRLVRRKEDRYEDVYGIGIKQVFGGVRADWMDATNTASKTINQSSIQFNAYAL